MPDDSSKYQDLGDDDILERILRFLEDWELKIYDNEYRLEQAARIEKRIEESLNKQLEEAVITRSDYNVIKDVAHTWTSLLGSLTAHRTAGNKHLKLQIVTLTLKLHRLDYISPILASDILTSL